MEIDFDHNVIFSLTIIAYPNLTADDHSSDIEVDHPLAARPMTATRNQSVPRLLLSS
jgi:hypothetical protein